MGKLRLQSHYNEVKQYLESLSKDELDKAVAHEQKNVRPGVSNERRKECVAYGLFFHLEYELHKLISIDADHQDEYIANLMIKVCKDMGIYDNF